MDIHKGTTTCSRLTLKSWHKAESKQLFNSWQGDESISRSVIQSFNQWVNRSARDIRELKQPRRRRQQKPHKFPYLTLKNSIFARFARWFLIFWHFKDVLVLSTTWNDLFCSWVDDVSIWWQMFNFVFLCPKRWFQFNSRIVRTNFSSKMTLNISKMIAETRSYIFSWRSRFRRRLVCLSSLLSVS